MILSVSMINWYNKNYKNYRILKLLRNQKASDHYLTPFLFGIHPKAGIPAVEIAFTILHAGGKSDSAGYKVVSFHLARMYLFPELHAVEMRYIH